MPVVESRYAEALLSVIPSADAADGIETTLSELSALWRSHEELRYFMLNPVIPDNVKKDTVLKILSEDAPQVLVNFLSLIVDKDRLALLPDIHVAYRQLKNKRRQNLVIEVYSASTLDERQMSQIREKYRNQYGALTAETFNYLDPSLLGGVRIKIGDTYIDDTLMGRLQGISLKFSY